jgi:hypothetical protein
VDFSVEPIITRLAELETAGTFRQVGGAGDLAAAYNELKQTPALFVIPARNTGGKNELSTDPDVRQKISMNFAVVYGVQHLRDAANRSALDALAPLRTAVFDKLIAWRPSGDGDLVLFTAGQLIANRAQDRTLWWQDVFSTGFFYRKV